MINTAIGIIGIAALASALDEYESSLNQNDTPQRPGEYTVSS
ncbi:hypothetical protein CP8484711_1335, partial [Chlamydia psittaci 84-8471/1]